MSINTNIWNVTDTEGKLTVANGVLNCSGGKSTPAWDDPRLSSVQGFSVVAGLTLEMELTWSNFGPINGIQVGFDTTNPIAVTLRPGFSVSPGGVIGIQAASVLPNTPAALSLATSYRFRLVLKNGGAIWYYSTDGGVTWLALWEDASGSTGTLYLGYSNYTAAFTSDFIRLYKGQIKAKAVNTAPAAPTPTYGAELLTDGALEVWTSTTDLTNWLEQIAGTSTVNREGTTLHGGTYACRLDVDGSASTCQIYQTVTAPAGSWILMTGWGKVSDATGNPTIRLNLSGAYFGSELALTTNYAQLKQTQRALAANPAIYVQRGTVATANKSIYVDDLSVKVATTASLLTASSDAGTKNGVFDCAPTVAAGQAVGMVTCLDNASNPQNYLHAYVDRGSGKAFLLKVVGGVTTELIAGNITYVAGRQLRVVSSGTKHVLYYDGTQIGTAQTVDTSTGFGTLMAGFQTDSGDSVGTLAANV